MTTLHFPEGFLWGAATAAYQIEGAAHEDGRRDSIWDRFSREPGAVDRGANGDVACDHYHRMPSDVALMKELGLASYRFSTSWARIRPDDGEFNPAGLDFYSRLVDELLAVGIEPWVTLYHWDLPATLQDRGGWTERDTAYRFVEYAEKVLSVLGDRVQNWTTLNEPWCSSMLGYASGEHAPGRTEPREAVRAVHHLLLAHGLGVERLRELAPGKAYGITLNQGYPVPADPGNAEDVAAARAVDGLANRLFLDPVFRGTYPEDMWELLAPYGLEEVVRDGDLETIAQDIDVLGLNFYNGHAVTGDPGAPREPRRGPTGRALGDPNVGAEWVTAVPRGLPVTEMGWEIDRGDLLQTLLRLHRDYTGPAGIPVCIMENGAAMPDAPDGSGFVDDRDRIEFLRGSLQSCHEAIAAGVDLRGFHVWSLFDNFEWAFGYGKRFGIVRVDYETQRRIPKASAAFFRDVIARNALETA